MADLGIGDGFDTAERVATDFERQIACFSNSRAVAEQVHLLKRHGFACIERGFHRCLAGAFDTGDGDIRPIGFEPGGNTCREAAAADLEKGSIKRPVARQDDLIGQRALACHHQEIVVGMDVNRAGERLIFARGLQRIVITIARKKDFHQLPAMLDYCGLFHLGCGAWHVDACADAEGIGGERHALGMVSGGGGDHAAFRFAGCEGGHAVAGTAPFVGFHGGEILAFHPDFRARAGQFEFFERSGLAETIDTLPCQQDFLAQPLIERHVLAVHAQLMNDGGALRKTLGIMGLQRRLPHHGTRGVNPGVDRL